MGFTNPVTVKYGLYGQGWWAWRCQRSSIVDSGIVGYDSDSFPSDGYTLYVEMRFNKLSGNADGIGMDIHLPNGDGTDIEGFSLRYDLATNTY